MQDGVLRQCRVVLASAVLLVVGCTGTPDRGAPGRYALDSATTGCRQRPELCARVAGEETVVPTARSGEALASMLRTGAPALRLLDGREELLITKLLERCAEQARSVVLDEQLGGRSPTPRECSDEVYDPETGRRITRAMLLGCFMHRAAKECTREALGKLRPGGFSLEQRYRFDRRTKALELVSEVEARSLVRQGCSDELTGTLVPDVVIHAGDPLHMQAVYDFKFPCVSSGRPPQWRDYPPGHPYHPASQGDMYKEAFGPRVKRIIPRLGAVP